MSKKKNIIARVGNFEIAKDSSSEHEYIRIRAVNGHWSVSHRDDSTMFGVWTAMCNDPDYAKGMEVLVTMQYTLTNSFVDEQFVRDYFAAYDALNKRREAAAPVPTEEEEGEALKDAEIMEEAKEVLNDVQK